MIESSYPPYVDIDGWFTLAVMWWWCVIVDELSGKLTTTIKFKMVAVEDNFQTDYQDYELMSNCFFVHQNSKLWTSTILKMIVGTLVLPPVITVTLCLHW